MPKSFIKKVENNKLMEDWQSLWDLSSKGRVLCDLIPKVGRALWFVPHQLAQLMTGHGPFTAYLSRIGRTDDP